MSDKPYLEVIAHKILRANDSDLEMSQGEAVRLTCEIVDILKDSISFREEMRRMLEEE